MSNAVKYTLAIMRAVTFLVLSLVLLTVITGFYEYWLSFQDTVESQIIDRVEIGTYKLILAQAEDDERRSYSTFTVQGQDETMIKKITPARNLRLSADGTIVFIDSKNGVYEYHIPTQQFKEPQ